MKIDSVKLDRMRCRARKLGMSLIYLLLHGHLPHLHLYDSGGGLVYRCLSLGNMDLKITKIEIGE